MLYFPQSVCSVQRLSALHQLCQDRVYPSPQSFHILIKGQYRPGCNWKQTQADSPSSRNMLSTCKRFTFQRMNWKKRKKRKEKSDRTETLQVFFLEGTFCWKGVDLQHMILSVSATVQSTCMLFFIVSIATVWSTMWRAGRRPESTQHEVWLHSVVKGAGAFQNAQLKKRICRETSLYL